MGHLSKFYNKEFESIRELYPDLKAVFNGKLWQLKGYLDIIDEFGKKWDRYRVKIVYPYNFPNATPVLFETEGRIPHEADFHINSDGSCCLTVPAMEIVILKRGINTLDFIRELVIPFLANQTYKRKLGDYAGKEFGHGSKGIYQFYKDVFKIDDTGHLISAIGRVLNNSLPGRNDSCFCGSSLKFKRCHQSAIEYLKPVPKDIILKDFRTLEEYRNEKINLKNNVREQ
jgi:hypothetical protein